MYEANNFALVCGPTIPSTEIFAEDWKALTAVRVGSSSFPWIAPAYKGFPDPSFRNESTDWWTRVPQSSPSRPVESETHPSTFRVRRQYNE